MTKQYKCGSSLLIKSQSSEWTVIDCLTAPSSGHQKFRAVCSLTPHCTLKWLNIERYSLSGKRFRSLLLIQLFYCILCFNYNSASYNISEIIWCKTAMKKFLSMTNTVPERSILMSTNWPETSIKTGLS